MYAVFAPADEGCRKEMEKKIKIAKGLINYKPYPKELVSRVTRRDITGVTAAATNVPTWTPPITPTVTLRKAERTWGIAPISPRL